MPIYDDIRETMQSALSGASGLPSFFPEGTPQDVDPSTAYMGDELFVTSRRPAVRGPSPQMRYQGLYRVTICTPRQTGTGNALRFAEIVSDTFDGSSDIVGPNKTVSVEYSELGTSFESDTHYCLPVDVAWYIYDA